MTVTDVRIKLATPDEANDRILAYVTVTFDETFVVHDIKIIDGSRGHFVAMPSRRHGVTCETCRSKSPRLSNYCGRCGRKLPNEQPLGVRPDGSPDRAFYDIAHPISPKFREYLVTEILKAWEHEKTLTADARGNR